MTALGAVKDVAKEAAPAVDPTNKRAGYLLLGLTLFTGLLVALGVPSDQLPRVWRNHAVLGIAAVVLVLIAISLGAYAGWVLQQGDRNERRALLWGNVVLCVGLIITAVLAIVTAADRPQPTITAAPIHEKNGTLLDVTVTDNGLKVGDDLSVAVEPVTEVLRDGEVHHVAGTPLYGASLGPNRDGDVSHSFKIELPPGPYQDVGVRTWVDERPTGCYDKGTTTGCVLVHLRRHREKPQLSYAWNTAHHRPQLQIGLKAHAILDRTMHLAVTDALRQSTVIAETSLPANAGGDFRRIMNFAIPQGVSSVCVVASESTQSSRCPSEDLEAAWIRVPVPVGP